MAVLHRVHKVNMVAISTSRARARAEVRRITDSRLIFECCSTTRWAQVNRAPTVQVPNPPLGAFRFLAQKSRGSCDAPAN